MTRGFYITGTDTGVGKTLVACSLLRAFAARGIAAAGMKPVAAGAARTAEGLRNDDALALAAASGVLLPYEVVNPYCFEPAIAPHLAAREAGVEIDPGAILMAYLQLVARVPVAVVEGAGGWLVPLNGAVTFAALPALLSLDVILVVGLRLGCLNHALLTAQSIAQYGCRPVGWVGNVIDPDFEPLEQNVATLREWLPMPCLGVIPRLPVEGLAGAAAHLDIGPLLAGR